MCVSRYWLFESWGRTGTTIGSKKLKAYYRLQPALAQYDAVYKSKTGNMFNCQAFKKQPNKFFKLDVDMEMPVKSSETFKQSNLNKTVYDLMEMLFDIKDLNYATVGYELNLEEFPLGKLSANQVKQAMSALKNINILIHFHSLHHKLIAASNKFYTLLPHAFGTYRPPIIHSIEIINTKSQLLEKLSNVTMIHEFLDGDNSESLHPYDLCYRKLHASIEPLEKQSELYQQLCDVVRGTSHRYAGLQVLEIFKVQREAESDLDGNCHINFKFRNHQLLWHGSRTLNFANIIGIIRK